jgi:hypothetical protein
MVCPLKLILAVILAVCPALMPALLLAPNVSAANACHAVGKPCCTPPAQPPGTDQSGKECPDCFSCWINCCGLALVSTQTFAFLEIPPARFLTQSENGSVRTYPPPVPPPRALA